MNSRQHHHQWQPFKYILFILSWRIHAGSRLKYVSAKALKVLVSGFEKAVWELGYVAGEHRTDNLTAATKAMGSRREFTERWQKWLWLITKSNQLLIILGKSHENGSIEKKKPWFVENAIDQTLMVRGSWFPNSKGLYRVFAEDSWWAQQIPDGSVWKKRSCCKSSLIENGIHLKLLLRVSSGSIIQLLDKPYSVPSRLIHYTLKAYIYPEEIILFYGNKQLQVMPRNYGDGLED